QVWYVSSRNKHIRGNASKYIRMYTQRDTVRVHRYNSGWVMSGAERALVTSTVEMVQQATTANSVRISKMNERESGRWSQNRDTSPVSQAAAATHMQSRSRICSESLYDGMNSLY